MIGGERVKSPPCWIVIGGEREKVGHVGFGRGVTSFFWAIGMSLSNPKIGGGVSDVTRVEKKMNISFFNENEKTAWTERYKRERRPGRSVTAGVPFSFLFFGKKESRNKTNKTMSQTSCLGFLQVGTDHVRQQRFYIE